MELLSVGQLARVMEGQEPSTQLIVQVTHNLLIRYPLYTSPGNSRHTDQVPTIHQARCQGTHDTSLS